MIIQRYTNTGRVPQLMLVCSGTELWVQRSGNGVISVVWAGEVINGSCNCRDRWALHCIETHLSVCTKCTLQCGLYVSKMREYERYSTDHNMRTCISQFQSSYK